MDVAGLILAAGASTRMGKSKQLLPWKSGTLLTHAIDTMRHLGDWIIVVLGANEEETRKSIQQYKLDIVSNPVWERGMGSSLKAGLQKILQTDPSVDGILIMVCDQPFVTAEHLRSLIHAAEQPGIKAVFSKYDGTMGVPAVLMNDLFDEIRTLNDDQGAKKIAQQLRPEEVLMIELKDGEIDLDTSEQYLKYKPA